MWLSRSRNVVFVADASSSYPVISCVRLGRCGALIRSAGLHGDARIGRISYPHASKRCDSSWPPRFRLHSRLPLRCFGFSLVLGGAAPPVHPGGRGASEAPLRSVEPPPAPERFHRRREGREAMALTAPMPAMPISRFAPLRSRVVYGCSIGLPHRRHRLVLMASLLGQITIPPVSPAAGPRPPA